ncbi:MAG: hypothetical protein MJ067_06455, partial [Oscillospiraceae bacterium]|nr:hypothetical protein [Oscillospiraceae bacterium]
MKKHHFGFKLLSAALVLSMLLSMLCGAFAFAEEPSDGFKQASELTEGSRYTIVTEYEGKNYAFNYTEAGLGAEEISVKDDIALPSSDAAVWFAREDNTIENAGTPGIFIYAGSYGLMTYSTGRTFVYDDSTGTILMHNLYYLTFDGVAFGQSKEAGDACSVKIYGKADEEGKDFELAAAFTEGDQYVITAEFEGKNYAFNFTEAGLGAEEVRIEGNIALPASDAAKWFARPDSAIENAGTPGTF